ncbi:MAG: PASTA domain-containing protein [Bacilli bacterium]|nr:PASTA domain-containing protein [Bacilli bacterium]
MKKLGIFIIVISGFLFLLYGLGYTDGKSINEKEKEILLNNLVGMRIEEVENYCKKIDIKLEIEYEYSTTVDENIVISQDIASGEIVSSGDVVKVVVSKGNISVSVYQEYKVNELGKVPIMMYHGIVDMKSSDTEYRGGNVDKDGYNRTVEAFRNDLEFYYQKGYRMIKLEDYVNGIIDVELGKSPIILTFDDGNENNFKVLGEENGELIIDPNCAVGVLEEFKKKYPDYGVTATFFVNSGLFGQEEYNDKILKWLVDNGYDIGNHTMTHVDFTKIDINKTKEEVGGLYQILDGIIPNEYVNIIALPFGSPYKSNHDNYSTILNGEFNGKVYQTQAALRVGWEAEVSCFDIEFTPTFLKRIRAYDNGGEEFDIEMNFKILDNNKYISDGDVNTVVALEGDKNKISSNDREVILY